MRQGKEEGVGGGRHMWGRAGVLWRTHFVRSWLGVIRCCRVGCCTWLR